MTPPSSKTAVTEIYKDNLWWLPNAWSEDVLEWLTAAGLKYEELGYYDLREEFFEDELLTNIAPYMPEMKPSIEWMVRYFLRFGDPHRDPKSYRLVDRVEPTQFVYDKSSHLGEATQLLSYYMSGYSNSLGVHPSSVWRDNPGIRHRVEHLVRIIPFTQAEWDWVAGAGAGDPYNSLYSNVISNPATINLETREGSGKSLFEELFRNGKRHADEYLELTLVRAQGEAAKSLAATPPGAKLRKAKDKYALVGKGLADHPTKYWLYSPLTTTAQLEAFADTYSEAGEALASVQKAKQETGERVDFRELHLLCQILEGITKHSNYSGKRLRTLDRLNSFWDDEDLRGGHWEEGLAVSAQVEAEKLSTQEAKDWMLLIRDQEGVAIEEQVSTVQEVAAVLHAYNHFTPVDAQQMFDELVVDSRGRIERGLALTIMLLPLLSVGFSNLRKEYGDEGGDIPLEWLIQAGGLRTSEQV